MEARVTVVKGDGWQADTRPWLCFIPGGPGLSSATLRSMDLLKRSFNLLYVDPPGTGGLPDVADPAFADVVRALETAVIPYRPLVLCGHSFGGIYGAALIGRTRIQVSAFVSIAAPFTPETYEVALGNYDRHRTPELDRAAKEWGEAPSCNSMRCWLANYGVLYFSPRTVKSGSDLLMQDQVSLATFQNVDLSKVISEADFLRVLRGSSVPKWFVAGECDQLIASACIKREAEASGARYEVIPNAGHFVTFDQPSAVADLIERAFINRKGD